LSIVHRSAPSEAINQATRPTGGEASATGGASVTGAGERDALGEGDRSGQLDGRRSSGWGRSEVASCGQSVELPEHCACPPRAR
jgi:hypothetical protein